MLLSSQVIVITDFTCTYSKLLYPKLVMAELILLRHGRSKNNENGTTQGSDPDPANTLDELGEHQADRLGQILEDRGVSPAGAWSSPLPRARQTCDRVLGVMGCDVLVVEDPRLVEMCKGRKGLPGGLEGRSHDEVKTPAYRQAFKEQGWKFRHGSLESGGETAEEVGRRVLSAMNDYADQLGTGETGLVFGHGQANRFGVGAALGWPDFQWLATECRLGNCEGLIMDRTAGLWRFTGRVTLGEFS
jgi:broad specificity phosphatase PhoE